MKSQLTKDLELRFVNYLYDKRYELAVLECSLGANKKYGIVDVLSYHGQRISHGRGKPRTRDVTWRCYEIKTSKTDFYSKHKWTFVGDYNYFVVPDNLYETIKADIPEGVGCYIWDGKVNGFTIKKRAKVSKKPLSDSQMMHDYLVSNNRDARRWVNAN